MRNGLIKYLSVFLAAALIFSFAPMTFAGIKIIIPDNNSEPEYYHYESGETSEFGYTESYLVNSLGEKVNLETEAMKSAYAQGKNDYANAEEYNLPASYDSRDYGLITSVKNQAGGTCWAYSALSAFETSCIKQGLTSYGTPDFSEMHLAWFASHTKTTNTSDPTYGDGEANVADFLNVGGNPDYAFAVLSRWSGAAYDYRYPVQSTDALTASYYKSNMTEADRYVSDAHLADYELMNSREDAKKAIIDYGCVSAAFHCDYAAFSSKYAYYQPSQNYGGHQITIVGWDDNYSRNNFNSALKPTSDGAWLCKNSWGEAWGNSGYFWMSYEQEITYEEYAAFIADDNFYDNNYQYTGYRYSYLSIEDPDASSANVFKTDSAETLKAVGVFSPLRDTNFTVKIYKNLSASYTSPADGTLAAEHTFSYDNAGYHTFELDSGISLAAGEIYSVVVNASTNWTRATYMTVEYGSSTVQQKQSYIYYNGKWSDSYNYGNTYIRAFTDEEQISGEYTVSFTCGEHSVTAESSGGKVTLPQAPDGYAYKFLYNGAEFRGENVTEDMTVTAHMYSLSDVTVNADNPCEIESHCIYCGETVKSSPNHSFIPTVTTIWGCTQTDNVCSVCGYTKCEFEFPSGSINGIVSDNIGWFIMPSSKTIYFTGKGEMPPHTGSALPVWTRYQSDIVNCCVSDGITSLCTGFLSGCTALKNVSLPDSITEISEKSFNGCSALLDFTMPAGVMTVMDSAFSGCTSLTEIYIPDATILLAKNSFADCTAITQVTGGTNVKRIGAGAFRNCGKLTFCRFPNIVSIDSEAFISTGLASFIIPASLTYLGGGAFADTQSLPFITVNSANKSYKTVNGAILTYDGKTMLYYPLAKRDALFVCPSGVETIEAQTFMNNAYIRYASLPKVRYINAYAFSGSAIEKINISSLSKIGVQALYNTPSLSSVYLPITLTSFSSKAVGYNDNGVVSGFTIYAPGSSFPVSYATANSITSVTSHSAHSKEWITYSEPTCILAGSKYSVCTVCNTVEDVMTAIPATNEHTNIWVTDTEPTCGTDGAKHQVCTQCGTVANENTVIPATNEHTYVWITDTEPTCGTDGTKHQACSLCGTVANENTVIPATNEHTYVWITDTEPTCGTDGTKHQACSQCGTVTNENTVIPATNEHTYVWITDTEPTCITAGTHHRKCTVCGYETDYNSPLFTAVSHSYIWITDTEPTCVSGTRHLYCTVCGDITSEGTQIPAISEHSYSWYTDTEPTCTTDGVKHEVCAVCGNTRSINTVIPATGNHTYEWIIDTEPICTDGIKHQECSVCGNINAQNTVIPATEEHNYTWITDAEPTCATDGVKHEFCTVCGNTRSINTVIPATGNHTYEWIIDTEPTCTDGVKHQECTVCGKINAQNTVIPATEEHNYTWITDTEPTCATDGVKHEVCDVCGNTRSINTVIPATGNHTYEWVIDTEPTCTDGIKHQECSVCGKINAQNTVIPATEEHNYTWVTDNEPTCATDGVKHEFCDVCGNTRSLNTAIPATENHNYVWIIDTAPTCTDGMKHQECSVCGKINAQNTVIPATEEHNYTWVTDTEPTCATDGVKHEVCNVCGNTRSINTVIPATENHSYVWIIDTAPTCTDGMKHQECSVCGKINAQSTVIPATEEHNYSWITDTEPTCATDGVKHEFCDVCGNTRSINTVIPATGNHTYEWVIDTAPTCAENGRKHRHCTVCGNDTELNTIIYATNEHNYVWVTDSAATAESDGIQHRECTVCGNVTDENTVIPATGVETKPQSFIEKLSAFFKKILDFFKNLFK